MRARAVVGGAVGRSRRSEWPPRPGGAARAAGSQNWSFQDNLTWSDYKPLPGPDYSDPAIQPTVKKWKVALIMVDYPDRPFSGQPAGGLRRCSARRRVWAPRTPARRRCRSSTRTF